MTGYVISNLFWFTLGSIGIVFLTVASGGPSAPAWLADCLNFQTYSTLEPSARDACEVYLETLND